MSEAVERIIANYASESPGVIANLRRLMGHGALAGTGKLVILPVDQGFEHGPARSFQPNPERVRSALPPEPRGGGGLQRVRGAARVHRSGRARVRGQAAADPQGQQQRRARRSGPADAPRSPARSKDAQRLGCSAIGFTIYPGVRRAQRDVPPDPRPHRRGARGRPADDHLVVCARPEADSRTARPRSTSSRTRRTSRVSSARTSSRSSRRPTMIVQEGSEEVLREHPGLDAGGPHSPRREVVLRRQAHRHLLGRSGEGHGRGRRGDCAASRQGGGYGTIMGRNAFQRSRTKP